FAFPFRYAAYWVFDFVPAWAWALAVEHYLYAIAAGVLLLVGILGAINLQPVRTILLILFLVWGWHHGRAWGTKELPQTNQSPTQSREAAKEDPNVGSNETQNTTTAAETTISPQRHGDTENGTDSLVTSAP